MIKQLVLHFTDGGRFKWLHRVGCEANQGNGFGQSCQGWLACTEEPSRLPNTHETHSCGRDRPRRSLLPRVLQGRVSGERRRALTIAGFINAPSMDPSMAFFLRAAAFFTWLKRRRVTLRPGNSSSGWVRAMPADGAGRPRAPLAAAAAGSVCHSNGCAGTRPLVSRGNRNPSNTQPPLGGFRRCSERTPHAGALHGRRQAAPPPRPAPARPAALLAASRPARPRRGEPPPAPGSSRPPGRSPAAVPPAPHRRPASVPAAAPRRRAPPPAPSPSRKGGPFPASAAAAAAWSGPRPTASPPP